MPYLFLIICCQDWYNISSTECIIYFQNNKKENYARMKAGYGLVGRIIGLEEPKIVGIGWSCEINAFQATFFGHELLWCRDYR